jgi:CO/xanthine dehydrogenase FAD-binding subunit
MADVEFFKAADMKEACELLSKYGAKATVLAGGTDVMVFVNRGQLSPEVLVSIGDIGLNYIKTEDGHLIIGATTTHTEICKSEAVLKNVPLLAEACSQIGSSAIRNMGTVGGNLVTASPAADSAAALIALEAEVKLVSTKGERTVPVDSFFTGPGETIRKPDELLLEVIIPFQSSKTKWGWYKLGQRKADVCGAISAAIALQMGNGTCKKARIVLGAVAPVPLLTQKASAMLEGKKLDDALIQKAATAAAEETNPIDDWRATAWYRKRGSGAIVKRLLEKISK